MRWNVDFEIVSFVFQLIFVIFFKIKKHLPTRQNLFFLLTMVFSLVTVALDVVTAYINSYPGNFDMAFIHGLNAIFFACVPIMAVSFFIYILTLTEQYKFTNSPLFVVFCIPAVISLIMALSSPLTGFLYYFTPDLVYTQGPCYILEFVSNAFYIIIAAVFAIVYRERLSRIERNSIYVFCCMLTTGVVLQCTIFRWVLLTNATTSIALIVIYMALQNPDMYIDRSSGLFNLEAFSVMAKEHMLNGRQFSCIYFSVQELEKLEALYGAENVAAAFESMSSYVKKVFERKKAYRVDSSAFILLESGDDDFEVMVEAIRNRFNRSFEGATTTVVFTPLIIVIPYWQMPDGVPYIQTLINFVKLRFEQFQNNCIVEINDKVSDSIEHERAVERAIEVAIQNNSIQMYYQPIYSTVTGKISGCEALARLFDDEIGFIRPDEFILKAEENGNIIRLGEQIFEKVCRFVADQKPNQYGLEHVHINISPVQCMQENLAFKLISIADKYEVPHNLLDLEITETAAVEQNAVIKRNMDELIAASFTFSLDDYGTGFSNTATIIKLPFKSVKIDKSLLWSYFEYKNSMLPDLISMFHNQNLELIVEGVETKDMVEGLAAMKCQNLQGFYFSKPIPRREFMSYMREFNKNPRMY